MTRVKTGQTDDIPAGIYRTRDLEAHGLSRVQIRRLTARGELVAHGRGLYSTSETPVSTAHTLAEVCKRVPKGVVCLTSALQFHQLTTQNPWQVCLLLPRGYHAPTLDYPTLWIFRTSGEGLAEGVEEHRVEGVTVRVTGIARTVAECFKYRRRIGLDIALEALRESLVSKRVTVSDLSRYARLCRIETVMRPYLEAMLEALSA